MATIQRLTTNLWFATEAEEAARFYVSIFNNSSIGQISYYGTEGQEIHQRPPGSVMTIGFQLDGHSFLGLNSGLVFKFNEAIAFIINCKDQQEVDYYWNKLTVGGDPNAQQCGWLKDKFGLSWQVVPVQLSELLSGDKAKAGKVMSALLQMKKLDLAVLEKAAES